MLELKYRHYCNEYENIENYEKAKADNFEGWCIHHRLETHNSDGERRLVDIMKTELIALDMYYNRPADELIFLTRTEHRVLHCKGKSHSNETKKKIGEKSKGRQTMLGKHHSKESKKKMSDAHKNMSDETKDKISKAAKIRNIGRHWFNNGKEDKYCYECPPGFIPGRIKKL